MVDFAGGAGGALRPMSKLLTLLAVTLIWGSGPLMANPAGGVRGDGGSSVGGGTTAAPLLLPMLSFHFDGFLVAETGLLVGSGRESDVARAGRGGGAIGLLDNIAIGTGKRQGGSVGPFRRGRPEEVPDMMEEVLDCLLISRARLCEALANISKVSSLGVVGVDDGAPLPLRPRLRRRLVDAEREGEGEYSGLGTSMS